MAPDPFVIDAALVAGAVENARAQYRKDPLGSRLFASKQTREFVRKLQTLSEGFLCSGNKAGKSDTGGAVVVGCLQGRESIDGRTIQDVRDGVPRWELALPRMPRPCIWYMAVPSYKQAQDSGLSYVFKYLGDWPHTTQKFSGNVVQVHVRPIGWQNDDPDTWSKLVLFPFDGELPDGALIHGAWADEIPSEKLWREIRKRWIANHRMVRMATATPKERSRWEWWRKDYEAPTAQQFQVNTTVYDNQALSRDQLEEHVENAKKDPFCRAILYGEYVDAEGLCPLDYPSIQVQVSRAKSAPTRWDVDPRFEVWDEYDPEDPEVIAWDPASGTKGRDRSGLWAVGRRSGRGKVRLWDHVGTHDLAVLARRLGTERGLAVLWPEMNWGGETTALALRGYPNVGRERRVDTVTGRTVDEIGFWTTEPSRANLVESLNAALKEGSLQIPSREALESLMGIVLDVRNKLIRTPGQNWEDMICLGAIAHFRASRPVGPIPYRESPPNPAFASRREVFESTLRRSYGVDTSAPENAPDDDGAWDNP